MDCAEAIFAAERGVQRDPAGQIVRTGAAAGLLARLRREERADWSSLYRDVSRHARVLRRLRIAPSDLYRDTGRRTALGWVLRRVPLLGLLPVAIAFIGTVLFWPPYRVAGLLADRAVAALPVLALLTLGMHERLESAGRDARRYLLLRRRGQLRENLLRQQRDLYRRLVELYEEEMGPLPVGGTSSPTPGRE